MSIEKDIIPVIKGLILDTIIAVFKKIDPKRRHHCFEIFGYDFLIDEDLKV